MLSHPTPAAGDTPTDAFSILLSIWELSVLHDGTLDTAQDALHSIEDLAMAGLRAVGRASIRSLP